MFSNLRRENSVKIDDKIYFYLKINIKNFLKKFGNLYKNS